MENMSLSDIAAVTKDNDDYFGNGGMWIFALLILMMMGGGSRNECYTDRQGCWRYRNAWNKWHRAGVLR